MVLKPTCGRHSIYRGIHFSQRAFFCAQSWINHTTSTPQGSKPQTAWDALARIGAEVGETEVEWQEQKETVVPQLNDWLRTGATGLLIRIQGETMKDPGLATGRWAAAIVY